MFFEYTFDSISKVNRQCFFYDGSKGFIHKYISSENYHFKVSHTGVDSKYSYKIPMINLIKIHGSSSWNVIKENEYIEVKYENKLKKDLDCILGELNICDIEEKLEIWSSELNDENISYQNNNEKKLLLIKL